MVLKTDFKPVAISSPTLGIIVVSGPDMSHTHIYEIGKGEHFTKGDLRIHLLAKGMSYRLPVAE